MRQIEHRKIVGANCGASMMSCPNGNIVGGGGTVAWVGWIGLCSALPSNKLDALVCRQPIDAG